MLPSLPIMIASFSLLASTAGAPQWDNNEKLLSTRTMSLETRHPAPLANNVYKDNILLNLAYLDGRVKAKSDINWEYLRRPYVFEFRLNPGETFSYHEVVLPEYNGLNTKNTNAHFNGLEGFKSDGYLMGNGVCHLASLIHWSATDAGLLSVAPTNHNFANIPEVPREYGVSIYSTSPTQNLYITNNLDSQVIFRFQYIDNELTTSVLEVN